MKTIKKNLINFILVALLIFLLMICKEQIVFLFYYIKRGETFKFIFPFVNNQITNDTFFTIAIGRSIVEKGFTNMDTLTWHTNLDFPHSGVFDLIIYGIYNINQSLENIYIYTILMFCILMLLIYFISYKYNNDKKISIVYVLLAAYLGRFSFYARAWQFSFIFFVLEFYFVLKLRETNKLKYSIIIIILGILIANFHSSMYPIYFVILLPHIAEILLSKVNIKIKKVQIQKDIGDNLFLKTLLFSAFTGLLTPAGLAPYTDMIKAMLGESKRYIGELSQITFDHNEFFFIINAFIIIILIFGKQKNRITDILYIFGFAILTIFVYRAIFFYIFISGISVSKIVTDFFKANNFYVNKYLKNSVIICSCILYIILVLINNFRVMNFELVSNNIYPVELSEYILKNIDLNNMRICNGFNYGSYLEYKGIKTFIDSRSGMFCDEFNKGCTILKDWYAIYNENYKEYFDKYDFTHIVVKNTDSLCNKLAFDKEWNVIYEDDYWKLYEKTNLNK